MSRQPTNEAAPFPAIIPASTKCSICLEDVFDDNQKGISKLQCGHLFHLACVGVAFNEKGAMVCPNCRKVEDSEWKSFQVNSAHNQPTSHGEASSDDDDDSHVYREFTFVMHEGTPDLFPYYDGSSHVMYQSLQATHGSLLEGQFNQLERMFGPFPYSRTYEVPSFDYGSDSRNNRPTPFVHFRQHTYVAPTGLSVGEYSTIGYQANPPSISLVHDLDDYIRLLQNMNGFGLDTGSPRAGPPTQGGMSNPSNTRPYLNIQPSLDLPSSSTPPDMARGIHFNGELDIYTPEAPVLYHGSSSSIASADPPELGLNMSIGGGPLYGNNYTSQREGAIIINSPQKIPDRVYGSSAFPIDLDDVPDGESPN